ncbi:MAG: ABC transporter permease, partial [Gemmatimonadetes bacterium]|nr:ABC transporter permease [Gemmatimonadota bacterium]
MTVKVLVRVALQSIVKNKLRTGLTMLGVVIGVGAVIVMVAIGGGAQGRIQEQIDNLGTNMLVVTPGFTQQGGANQGAGSFNRLKVEDAQLLQREGTLFSAVSPVINTRAQAIGGDGNWRTEVMGVAASYQAIRDWSLDDGAFFTDADQRGMRKVAVLGHTVADALFPDGGAVGARVQLRNVPFTIVGVLAEKGQTASGGDQDDMVLVPYPTMQTRLAGFSFISQILVSTASLEQIEAAQAEVRVLMREAHDLVNGDADDFTVRNQNEIAAAAKGTTRVMTLLLAAIASVSLLVGGIGIMNIMLVSVTERT